MTLSESDYEMAAQLYFDQITEDKYGNEAYNRWRISTDGVFFTTNSAPTSGDTLSWRSLLYPERSETTGAIVNSMQYGYLSQIMTMNDSLEIIPTQNSIENFDSQNYTGYVYNASGKTEDERNIISRRADKYNGDLRKYGSLYSSSKEPNVYDKYIFKYASRVSTGVSTPGDEEEGTETEYTSYYICPLIREQTVFLRYAESLNKLGKPNMAMAILKYDFSYRYFNYDSLGVVPKHEKVINYYTNSNGEVVESVSLPTYANVTKLNNLFNNTGIRKHGCGNVDKDSRYAIPDFTRYDDVMIKDEDGNEELVEVPTKNEALMALAKNDSIAFVDSLIFVEYGLETAYEGNRFFDIYRYAKRYKAEGVNDNFFGEVMSKKVTDVALTKEFFLNEQNWFIPEEGK